MFPYSLYLKDLRATGMNVKYFKVLKHDKEFQHSLIYVYIYFDVYTVIAHL